MWSLFSRDPSKDFAYEIGEEISGLEDRSIWSLHKSKKKVSGEEFSVFVCDCKQKSEVQFELAKSSLKKIKTLRHPSILTYVDSLETDRVVYIVTESVQPLENFISERRTDSHKLELNASWGLRQLLRAIDFLNNDCGILHANVCLPSIFVNQAGEWKLAGVEYMCKLAEMNSMPTVKIFPDLVKYDPPERKDSSYKKPAKPWSTDMWGLGCVIWEVFNGNLSKQTNLKAPGKVPKLLVSVYCEMVAANPSSRPNPADVIQKCSVEGGFLNNKFVSSLLFLEEIQIKDSEEKNRFFSSLSQQLDSFPNETARYKILPQLITAFEFGSAGPAILTPMFKIGKLLDAEEYQKKIVPCVIKLFSSTDRATRAKLLQQLEHFVDYLQPNVINNQIYPEIAHGFMDTNATIREITVKATLHLAPKLNSNNLNVELMKHFARLQSKDDQGGIRTNTTVCLGKIAHLLQPDTRKKVLISAFSRSMRDPFPPARTAGILALAATQKFYLMEDVARRILPALCQMTIDPEKSVRDQAFKTIKGFITKLETISEDPALIEQMVAEVNASASSSVTDVAYSWAGWAMTSFTSKFYKSNEKNHSSEKRPSPVKQDATSPTKDVSKPSSTPTQSPVSHEKEIPTSEPRTRKNSDSDYGGDWDDDWGDIETSISQSESMNKVEQPVEESSGWDDAEFEPVDPSVKPASSYDWGISVETKENEFSNISNIQKKMPTQLSSHSIKDSNRDEWNTEDSSWKMWDDSETLSSKPKSSTEEREMKRNQRKKELEEKRAARQGKSGPLKLGERRNFT